MFTSKQISVLKKANASVDSEKTKIRISEDFKSASAAQKKEIYELSQLPPNSFYGAAKTGSASPRIVVSVSQVLSVSPYYYTGETDEKNILNESDLNAELLEFSKKYSAQNQILKQKPTKLQSKKVNKKIKETKIQKPVKQAKEVAPEVKAPKNTRLINKATIQPAKEIDGLQNLGLDYSARMNKSVKDLDTESAVLLLKALMKRAETGGKSAILCDLVKRCLLS